MSDRLAYSHLVAMIAACCQAEMTSRRRMRAVHRRVDVRQTAEDVELYVRDKMFPRDSIC